MKSIIAKKVGMTQLFDENSISMGVTVLDVSGCRVVQIKSNEKDGYSAAQLTIGSAKNVAKPLLQLPSKINFIIVFVVMNELNGISLQVSQ